MLQSALKIIRFDEKLKSELIDYYPECSRLESDGETLVVFSRDGRKRAVYKSEAKVREIANASLYETPVR